MICPLERPVCRRGNLSNLYNVAAGLGNVAVFLGLVLIPLN